MTEHWVINASPLILLGKSGQLDWLPQLGQIIIPKGVADEVAEGSNQDPAKMWLESKAGKECIFEVERASDEILAWDLGKGETEVLAWLQKHAHFEAVLDDAAARRCAAIFGFCVRGTLSLVALAKKRGFVKECRPVFERLKTAGLFVTPSLIEKVAQSVGE